MGNYVYMNSTCILKNEVLIKCTNHRDITIYLYGHQKFTLRTSTQWIKHFDNTIKFIFFLLPRYQQKDVTCYYGFKRQWSCRDPTRVMLILPMLLYDVQIWMLLRTVAVNFEIFEKKESIAHDIHIKSRKDMCEIPNDMDVV